MIPNLTRAVISIDPGNTTGWAVFYDRVLIECAAEPFEKVFRSPPGSDYSANVFIEVPRSYRGKEKGDQNDLIDLAVRTGELSGWYRRKSWVENVRLLTPREWKGTVPKAIHNQRVLSRLSEIELALLPRSSRAKNFNHNMVDAIGIGLWALGRM